MLIRISMGRTHGSFAPIGAFSAHLHGATRTEWIAAVRITAPACAAANRKWYAGRPRTDMN
ncbi:hypothetical protein EDD93_6469 [Streptomyces sp. 840.1]|nr:hypothetical protein EDD93_6469 [Streptomyces sp. 840.1]